MEEDAEVAVEVGVDAVVAHVEDVHVEVAHEEVMGGVVVVVVHVADVGKLLRALR